MTFKAAKNILIRSEDLLQRAQGNQNPELIAALGQLKSGIVTLVNSTNDQNGAVEALNLSVINLNNAKARFPDGKFTATLDLMITLTQEFAADHANDVTQLNQYVSQMENLQDLIEQDSAEAAALVEQLAATKVEVEKHSFAELGALRQHRLFSKCCITNKKTRHRGVCARALGNIVGVDFTELLNSIYSIEVSMMEPYPE